MGTVYCWRGGQIDFGRRAPRNALPLAQGPMRNLRSIVLICARHAYDGKTLLVPGIPEADSDGEALAAAVKFSDEIKKRLYREPSFGRAS